MVNPGGSSESKSKSKPLSPLRWVTHRSPTNYNMLLFRTQPRELGHPNANEDHLAVLLRDKLMPLRMWWLKQVPGAKRMFLSGLEHPKFGVPGMLAFVDARTSWLDAVVREALISGTIKQVVAVAAGFDTRAYRFGAQHPDVAFFEVDLPAASKKKQQLVAELLPADRYPRPAFLAADLAATPLDAVLLAPGSGFDPTMSTLFTVEGLCYYLPHEAVVALFAALLRAAPPGSRVAFDFLHQQVLEGKVTPPAYKVTAASVANKGEPFVSGMPDSKAGVQGFLSAVPSPPPAAGEDAAAAAGGDSASSRGASSRVFAVSEYLGPREMVARHLPHLLPRWSDEAAAPQS